MKDENETKTDRMITLKEFAERICVSVRDFYRMIDEGIVPPPVKHENRKKSLYFFEDYEKYVESLKLQRR